MELVVISNFAFVLGRKVIHNSMKICLAVACAYIYKVIVVAIKASNAGA
jgi:hypothetical protein